MEDVTVRKRDIEENLKLSEVRLNELKEGLEKSEQLTNGMVGILDSFSVRLKKMDEAIMPVYQQTRRLTQLQENVDKTIVQMERVIGFYHLANEVEIKVQNGPISGVDGYIKVLERLRVALDFFQSNNPSSVELSHVQELFESGLESLQRDFLASLKQSSRPVAVAILNDIASCEDPEDLPPLEHLPARTVNDLRVTAEYLIVQSNTGALLSLRHKDILSVYSQLRSSQLGRSLNAFKEANFSSQNYPSSIPKKSSFAVSLLKGYGPSPYKKVNKRSEATRRAESVPGGPYAGELVVGGGGGGGGGAEEQLEGCAYVMASTTVFLRLIEGETHLMRQIIPPQHHLRVLRDLTAHPIEFYMKEVDMLYQLATKNLAHGSYPVVISVFRLIKHLQSLLPQYQPVLKGLDGAPYERFEGLVKQFQKLNQKSLEDYISHIKGNPEKQSNLPKDGTVHELTSHTMWFLEQLLEYSSNVGEAILGQSSFGAIPEAERRKALGHFLVRVLDALNLNMENKAHSYESSQLASLFLMNNYHFIHKTFSRHELMLKLLEEEYDRIDSDYISHVETHTRTYQRSFAKLISYLGQEVSAASGGSDKLSKNAKQALKDKFKGFNTELEEVYRVQLHWSIPDKDLRERVRHNNIEIVGPLYTEFYRVYSLVNFTKNPEKYLKYTPEMLEATMKKFFDSGL